MSNVGPNFYDHPAADTACAIHVDADSVYDRIIHEVETSFNIDPAAVLLTVTIDATVVRKSYVTVGGPAPRSWSVFLPKGSTADIGLEAAVGGTGTLDCRVDRLMKMSGSYGIVPTE